MVRRAFIVTGDGEDKRRVPVGPTLTLGRAVDCGFVIDDQYPGCVCVGHGLSWHPAAKIAFSGCSCLAFARFYDAANPKEPVAVNGRPVNIRFAAGQEQMVLLTTKRCRAKIVYGTARVQKTTQYSLAAEAVFRYTEKQAESISAQGRMKILRLQTGQCVAETRRIRTDLSSANCSARIIYLRF